MSDPHLSDLLQSLLSRVYRSLAVPASLLAAGPTTATEVALTSSCFERQLEATREMLMTLTRVYTNKAYRLFYRRPRRACRRSHNRRPPGANRSAWYHQRRGSRVAVVVT